MTTDITLNDLVRSYRGKFCVNAWIEFEGFRSLYVRVCKKYIHGQYVDAIDLATLNAENPGKGAFKSLVKHIKEKYPTFTIHVESVLSSRFGEGLKKMGFRSTGFPNNFYLPKDV